MGHFFPVPSIMGGSQIYLVPGPTQPHPDVLSEYNQFVGSSDVSVSEFAREYDQVAGMIGEMVKKPDTSSVVVMSGEGMLALWSALSSCLCPGDRVLAIDSGLFGNGIGEMARSRGADVKFFSTGEGCPISAQHRADFEEMMRSYQPHMVTLVHCETPSGSLVSHDSLEEIGQLCKELNCLFYVDMVSSAGGTYMNLSENFIDLALIGSQKCLSLHSDLSILVVSQKAWNVMEEKRSDYKGYDALLPWKTVVQENSPVSDRLFPYTMNWSSLRALRKSLAMLSEEGWEEVFERHTVTADYCRERINQMGLQLHVSEHASPSVTAIQVPSQISWEDLRDKLQSRGVHVGGNYAHLAGKVFRIGHMGTQADLDLVKKALDILENILTE